MTEHVQNGKGSECNVRDLARLGVSQDWELRNWSEELGVTPEELRRAVSAVGLRVTAVRRYLSEQKKHPRPQPDPQ